MAIKNAWIFGIILVIIGSIGNNLGNNLVSLGHSIDQKKEEEENRLKKKLSTLGDVDNNPETASSSVADISSSIEPLQNSHSSESLVEVKEEKKKYFLSLHFIGILYMLLYIINITYIYGIYNK